jgi:hypothetical protein
VASPSPVADSGTGPTGIKNFIQQHLESLFAILILSSLAFYLLRQNLRLKAAERRQQAVTPPQTTDRQEDARTSDAQNGRPVSGREAARFQTDGPDERFRPGGHYSRPEIISYPLDEVRRLLENNDYKGFYRELNRAVWKAVSEKLNLPASELNKHNIAKQLQARGWDVDTTRSLENLLNECEINLYTPAYDPYNMQQLLRQAETLFRILIPNSSY